MNKQLLSEVLQQKLTQTKNLTEALLKNILEKLENQKTKLPLEDHSVIDWAIGAIRIRMQQREQLMDEVQQELENLKRDFARELGNTTEAKKICESFKDVLPRIMTVSVGSNYEQGPGRVIPNLFEPLWKHENLDENSRNQILEETLNFCRNNANKLNTNPQDEDERTRDIRIQLVENYNRTADHISSLRITSRESAK